MKKEGAESGSAEGRIYFQAGGYVGINNTDPRCRLDVTGAVLIRGENTNTPTPLLSTLELMTGRSSVYGFSPGQGSADISIQYGGGGYRHYIASRHSSAGGTQNGIDFYINNSSIPAGSSNLNTGNTLGMSITAAGVGVATTTPNAALDVLPTGGTNVMLGGGSVTGSEIKLSYTGVNHFSIYNNGNGNLTIAKPAPASHQIRRVHCWLPIPLAAITV